MNLAASFQLPEQGLEHNIETLKMPETSPGIAPERVITSDTYRPIIIKRVEDGTQDTSEARLSLWMRAADETAGSQQASHVLLAYASDLQLLPVALQPHGFRWDAPNLQLASLDHALWFHRPFDFNAWLLHTVSSPTAAGGRGFVQGQFREQDGTVVATVAQEGLIRVRAK
ncbi:hypothetical protein CA235_19120 [Sphingomonas sp. ABOLF]|uniref:acyl-CoA thioesterase domain-containing protein n=1 Tax=Sphingomonas sp. ABOLF TaxID=1985879 RepID=UPI000F7E79D2|nr:hypothetical protein CA235_19120 [Sphingomonas sp. ABOLF]